MFYEFRVRSALDFKTSLVYIELYQTIESIYRRYTGEEITAQDMQMLLKECMRRKEYRAPFARLVREYAVGNLERGALDAHGRRAPAAQRRSQTFVGRCGTRHRRSSPCINQSEENVKIFTFCFLKETNILSKNLFLCTPRFLPRPSILGGSTEDFYGGGRGCSTRRLKNTTRASGEIC